MLTLDRKSWGPWAVPVVTAAVGFAFGLSLAPSGAAPARVERTECVASASEPASRASTYVPRPAPGIATAAAASAATRKAEVDALTARTAAAAAAVREASAVAARDTVLREILDDATAALGLDEGTRELLAEAFGGANLSLGEGGTDIRGELRRALGDRAYARFDAYMRERARAQVRYHERGAFLGVAFELGLEDDQLPEFERAVRASGLLFSTADEIESRVGTWDRDGGDGGYYDETRAPEEIEARIRRQLEGLKTLPERLGEDLSPAQRHRLERWIERERWERAGALVALASAQG